jgi:hypothetical protein
MYQANFREILKPQRREMDLVINGICKLAIAGLSQLLGQHLSYPTSLPFQVKSSGLNTEDFHNVEYSAPSLRLGWNDPQLYPSAF